MTKGPLDSSLDANCHVPPGAPLPGATAVEIRERRRRGRLATFLSRLSCCRSSSISDSCHFHASRVEDSVHVMIKHDKAACKRRGVPVTGYTPRQPLAERLEAARRMEAARQKSSIEAREDDGEDILAAVTGASTMSGASAQ